MNDFMENIKITKEDKQESMKNILYTMINSDKIISLEELSKRASKSCSKLNENELRATYQLAKEVKVLTKSSNQSAKLLEYLGIKYTLDFDEDKLFELVSRIAEEIYKHGNAPTTMEALKRLEEDENNNSDECKVYPPKNDGSSR